MPTNTYLRKLIEHDELSLAIHDRSSYEVLEHTFKIDNSNLSAFDSIITNSVVEFSGTAITSIKQQLQIGMCCTSI